MKILVGIMHCIENEFEQCIASIRRQTHTDFEYFVIENMSNKDAHDKLYSTFMKSADKFDLFIKIDADMVLCRNTFFQEVIDKYNKLNGAFTDLEIGLFDFFTQKMIYGLHVYTKKAKWNLNSTDKLFVDKVLLGGTYLTDFDELAPAAIHCPDSSPFQSFHYGLHKAIKFMQVNQYEFQSVASNNHWNHIVGTYLHYRSQKNDSVIYAMGGVLMALKSRLRPENVDFDDVLANGKFHTFSRWGKRRKNIFILVNSIVRGLFFPTHFSYKINVLITKSNFIKASLLWFKISLYLLMQKIKKKS